jgi:hypothetical protein
MALSLGPDWQRDLWASQYRLRFELSRGGPHVNMFATSFDRARALARAALPTNEVIGVIAAYPDPKREIGANWRGWTEGNAFGLLKEMGVPTESKVAEWAGYWWSEDEADDETKPWVHRAVRLTWDQADIILWNQIAHDIGVTPQAPVMSKLVDLERSLSINTYDDRGMDITALSKGPISELYTRFDAWLLDCDRPRMSEAFKN